MPTNRKRNLPERSESALEQCQSVTPLRHDVPIRIFETG